MIFHFLLFWLYPLLFFYSHNREELFVAEIGIPLLICIAVAGSIIGLSYLFVRDTQKAALITSVYSLLFFSYGHVRTLLFPGSEGQAGPGRVLLPLFVLVAVFVPIILKKSGKRFNRLNKLLNYTAIALIAVPLFHTIRGGLSGGAASSKSTGSINSCDSVPEVTAQTPDIYYLVFDRYPSFANLEKYGRYDNNNFMRFLVGNGFDVSKSAFSNYPYTYLSLCATLNMSYLDEIKSLPDDMMYRKRDVYRLLTDNRVVTTAAKAGYRCLHIGSYFEPTRLFAQADRNYADGYSVSSCFGLKLKEPMVVFLRMTMLSPLLSRYCSSSHPQLHRRIVNEQLKAVEDACAEKGPKFVTAHFLLPHEPYVFLHDGSPINPDYGGDTRELFWEQLQYCNRVITHIITTIFEKSTRKPVIILQADEGCYHCFGRQHTEEEIPEKMGILYAHYLPPIDNRAVSPPGSPVNTFPVVFNNYAHTRFPIREDRFFFPEYEQGRMVTMVEITGRLKHLLSRGTIDTVPEEE